LDLFIACCPWIAVAAYLVLVVRTPRELSTEDIASGPAPFVSVVVPARNEEDNIGPCIRSLLAQDYPNYEVIVVDDRSTDGTRDRILGEANGTGPALRLVDGESPTKGWFGKPWACWQGVREARGEIFLFTDADTVHGEGLLRRAVSGLQAEKADLLTVIGRQIMVSFWEQILQPQFFMLLAYRYPRTDSPRKPHQWRHAIANGQFLLIPKRVYDEVGGHRAVAGEVAEDLRLAQHLVRGGWRVVVRGDQGLETRMYRSLAGLVEGWSKNVATAALQTTNRLLRPIILPLSLMVGLGLWLAPLLVLMISLGAGISGTVLSWSILATGISVGIWAWAYRLMGGNPFMGFLYPVGVCIGTYIFVRSWRRGAHIEWKDRRYEMPESVRWGGSP
jgi:chlorobactene glucosyltransferase